VDRRKIRVEILGLGVSRPLDQVDVRPGVVGHHQHRRLFKTLHQQTTLVIRGRIHRAADHFGAPLANPRFGGGQKLPRYVGPILTLKKTKETGPLTMSAIVGVIDDRRAPSHGFTAIGGEEKLDLRLPAAAVERVFLPIQKTADRGFERRDPVGISGVDLPWKVDELGQLTPPVDLRHLHAITPSSRPTLATASRAWSR